MKFIKELTWEDVFTSWRDREAQNPDWIACAKSKGWDSWTAWRMYMAETLELPQRSWRLYQFTNPGVEVPDMLVGPFQGWQNRVERKNAMTFANFADDERLREWMQSNEGIKEILKGLPFSTQMIGLEREGTGDVICFDGNHRAGAIALACDDQVDYANVEVTIALATLPRNETFLLDYALQVGSSVPS